MILNNSKLDVGAILFPELDVVFIADLLDHVESFTDELLLDDLEELVLLEGFTGNVEGKIIGVDNALHKGQVLGHHVFEVIGDEDTSDVHLDEVDLLAVVGEHVLGGLLGDEEDGLKGDLSLSGEVAASHGVLAVLAEALVERVVLVVFDLSGLAGPQGLGVVDEGPVPHSLVNLLGLLLLSLLQNFQTINICE